MDLSNACQQVIYEIKNNEANILLSFAGSGKEELFYS